MCDFRKAILDAGFTPPDHIVSGKFNRFPGIDKKPSNRAGYCILFDDCKAGVFGDFSNGFKQTWFDDDNRNLTLQERLKLREQIRVVEGHRRADLEIMRKDAANDANRLWESASKSIDHPYVFRKEIVPYGTRQKGNALLVPLYYQNSLWNLERIYPNGDKRPMKGGRVIGCYMPIGTISDHVYICEGYSTGCSLHQHTGTPVVVARNCGNLKPVALAIRKKYPNIRITLAADNDINTEGNPGLTKARAAASAVDGDVIWPDFTDEDFDGSDWNDYLTQGGKL